MVYAFVGNALMVARVAAALEGIDEAPVPTGNVSPGVGEGAARFVQEVDLVNRAIDGTPLAADYVGHRLALSRDSLHQILRQGSGWVQSFESDRNA